MESEAPGLLETPHSQEELAREMMHASIDVDLVAEEKKVNEKKSYRHGIDRTETADGFCTLKTREAKARVFSLETFE